MNRSMSWFPSLCAGLTITDGAWGTELQKRGLALGEPADLWNLTRPDDVAAVAASYVKAGSRVILTNTFRANAMAMPATISASEIEAINRRGAELSRRAAGSGARVFASMGPIGRQLTDGRADIQAAGAAFRAQAEALAAGGADAIVLETFSDLTEARIAVRAVKPLGLPVVVSFAFGRGQNLDRTIAGVSPEDAAAAMIEEGVDALGANCGAGPAGFVRVCQRLKAASGLPVWIKPNAGLPAIEAGKAVYPMSPEAFAGYLPALAAAGATFVGGCCGTSPAFIRALLAAAG